MSSNLTHQINMLCDLTHEASYFMQRDFSEMLQLQNSKRGVQDFANKCYDRIKYKLVKSLADQRPTYGVILPHEKPPTDCEFFIVIEPIAGLNNFKHSLPFCCIAVALFKKDSEEALAIAIHNPILRETFYAAKGLGSWFENYTETNVPKSRMRVSAQNSFSEAFISSNANNSNVNLGCTILEMAYLSAGRLDIIVKKHQNLIIKAAFTLIREAGGRIEFQGKDDFLASNEALHRQAVETLL